MPVRRWAESRRLRPSGLFVLAGGLLLAVWVATVRPGGMTLVASSALALLALGWAAWAGALRLLWSIPGNLQAWLIGGGNRQARRYRVHLTREALIYILVMTVLVLGAFLGHSNMLLLVFGLMAGPFVLNGQVTMAMIRKVRVSRRLPRSAMVGQPVHVELALHNQKRLLASWMIVLEDQISTADQFFRAPVLLMRVPARASRAVSYKLVPGRRGIYRFGPVRVASRFPLGLWERSFELNDFAELVVVPRVGRLHPRFHVRASAEQALSADAALHAGSSEHEFRRLREFRSGDSRRAIHWRTTARKNELMVREFQPRHMAELRLLVDLWVPRKPTPADLERVELAVSLAATICASHEGRAGRRGVDLILLGRQPIDLSGAALERQLAELAVVEPAVDAAPDAAAEQALACPATGPCRTMVLSARPQIDMLRARLEQAIDQAANGGASAVEVIPATRQTFADYVQFDESIEAPGS